MDANMVWKEMERILPMLLKEGLTLDALFPLTGSTFVDFSREFFQHVKTEALSMGPSGGLQGLRKLDLPATHREMTALALKARAPAISFAECFNVENDDYYAYGATVDPNSDAAIRAKYGRTASALNLSCDKFDYGHAGGRDTHTGENVMFDTDALEISLLKQQNVAKRYGGEMDRKHLALAPNGLQYLLEGRDRMRM